MLPRLFVANDLAKATVVAGSPAQAHYLCNVLRRGVGDPVLLFNGRDGEHGATIATARKDRVTFTVDIRRRPQAAEPDIWLAFALLKRDQNDLVVQKATELGVSALLPLLTERTNTARLNEDRLRAIAIEAAEQCERLTIPVLHPPCPLPELLAAWPPGRTLAAALERVPGLKPAGERALLTGPEGGFTPRELDLLHATPFIHAVSLGPRILRAETAAIAGLALLMAADW